ncbi:MAG: glycosyl transferase [Herminiimonas sp.]|nr:glycosyl transferase [Herminiimonas sp.]
MRLLFFIHSLGAGGAERVTASLANHWTAKGWDVTIVTLAPRAADFYELAPGVARIALNLAQESGDALTGSLRNIRRIAAVRASLRQVHPDVAVAMMTTANVILALAAAGLPGLCAIGSERTYPPLSPLGAVWETARRRAYGRLFAVVSQTRECAAWLGAHSRARRLPVIPNAACWPLPDQHPRIDPDAVCAPERRILLAVGRLSKTKGFDRLLHAFSSLCTRHPAWDLVILGEGPERSAMETAIHAGGLENRVFLPGRVGNVARWYERADLYAMTSRQEGFPNALVEALAHGLPAVSVDCDAGPRDIIRSEIDGLLVPRDDEAALEAALERTMGDPAMIDRFAARAAEARERFSFDRISRMWEILFEQGIDHARYADRLSAGPAADQKRNI